MSALPDCEVAIAGGGPAGLAVAIHAARAGLRTLLLERSDAAPDKACGEGLMPRGARALQALVPLERIPASERSTFSGIRYLLEDGRSVESRFRGGGALGIRRLALSTALGEAARESGAQLERAQVRGYSLLADGVRVETDRGPLRAGLLVGADGLNSPLRRAAGLEGETAPLQRFGLRRHFACAPWSELVEVYWSDLGECYVTPVGARQVNIAFLWEPKRDAASGDGGERFNQLLARFPAVASRLEGAALLSESRGSGPLWHLVRSRCAERLALVGDAAGYIDAITGQGLSLAFLGASTLIDSLRCEGVPEASFSSESVARALRRYDRALRSPWRRYALPARALLALARRPTLRRAALGLAVRTPRLFASLVESIGSD